MQKLLVLNEDNGSLLINICWNRLISNSSLSLSNIVGPVILLKDSLALQEGSSKYNIRFKYFTRLKKALGEIAPTPHIMTGNLKFNVQLGI